MKQEPEFEPTHPQCCFVWKHLTKEGQKERLAEALRREKIILKIQGRKKGESERAAIKRLGENRSNARRWQKRYKAYGLDGLIDWRAPPNGAIPEEICWEVCALRRVDSAIGVDKIISHIATHHQVSVSETTVKRVLRNAGLSRRRGPANVQSVGEQRIELGGMKLIEAAAEETGYLKAMTQGIKGIVDAALEMEGGEKEGDTSDRDAFGRFLPTYNKRFFKGSGDEIGPGFACVEKKRETLSPKQLHLSQASTEIIERKVLALLVSPLLGSGRWDGIRVPRGDLLGELCGYPYMPSTLDLFTRELKYLGVSQTLWEIHARLWLEQTRTWGSERSAAVFYVDETNKPIWTHLFSESSKVSSVRRVMPSLELVCFHTGYGVPIWLATESGRAPLVKAVPPLLCRLEEILGDVSVGRVIVMDAEGNSIPFLKELEGEASKRGWVMRLKASIMSGKEIYNRTSYRPYRDGDRIRMGMADFNDPEGETFRMRVIEIERRSKGTVTHLGASQLLDETEWKAVDIADLYFSRWPNQEANFRAVNRAIGFKDVHGYGKEFVDNISVISEMEHLARRISNLGEQEEKLATTIKELKQKLKQEEELLHRKERRSETVFRNIDDTIERRKFITKELQQLNNERRILTKEIKKLTATVTRLEKKVSSKEARHEQIKETFEKIVQYYDELESRRYIFRHDVELDSIFSLLKVGLVLLITYVLKEYFNDARMEAVTFLERVATLPARLRLTPQLEILTFEYNYRDPDVMALLSKHCDAINARCLKTRSGRGFYIKVEPAPPPKRPPPKQRRVNPGDRFVKS